MVDRILLDVLEDCPICRFHSASFSQMNCEAHRDIWEALEVYDHETHEINQVIGESKESVRELDNAMIKVRSHLLTALVSLRKIGEASDLQFTIDFGTTPVPP